MKVDLNLHERSVITTLLRREAFRLRGTVHAEATTDATTLLGYVEKIEQWPDETEPARVNLDRDLRV